MLGLDVLPAGVYDGDGSAYRQYRAAIAGRLKGHAYPSLRHARESNPTLRMDTAVRGTIVNLKVLGFDGTTDHALEIYHFTGRTSSLGSRAACATAKSILFRNGHCDVSHDGANAR